MSKAAVHLPVAGFGNTLRTDNWWAGPAATFTVLSSFILWATFRAFENKYFTFGPYLSPFYSPYIPTGSLPFLTPAMLILPGPAGFRLTCYYYRKAYYRSFGMDPPGCAVGEHAPHRYNGETKLFIFQNLHRFTLYVALFILACLWHDAWRALWWPEFHIGVGTLVLTLNASLLTGYTFSCHALRHLVGGGLDSFSEAPFGRLRHSLWKGVSFLNTGHSLWAWVSLFGVGLTDVYVRMVSTGVLHDVRIV